MTCTSYAPSLRIGTSDPDRRRKFKASLRHFAPGRPAPPTGRNSRLAHSIQRIRIFRRSGSEKPNHTFWSTGWRDL